MFPVTAITRPSALAGQTNGKLLGSSLRTAGGATLQTEASRAWVAMQAAAAKDGITLKSLSSYRDYAGQVRMYDLWKNGNGNRAAVPGTSNHGWGLAVDVDDMDATRLNWLVANEGRFGFSHEIQSEDWHVHFFAGDATPKAVTDHYTPAPTPSEEDEMQATLSWLSDGGSPALYLCAGTTASWVNGADAIAIATVRGAKVDSSTAAKPHGKAFLRQITVLDGPLIGTSKKV